MCALDDWTVDDVFDLVRRSAPFATLPRPVLDAVLDMLAGPLPQRRVRRAAAADRLGPRDRHAHRAPRRAAARGDLRRHDPRPRPLRGVPRRRREGRVAGSASSTRRWSTSRASATSSPSARRPGASRTSPTTRCSSRPAPGLPGRLPFWKGDSSAGRPSWAVRSGAFVREIDGAAPGRGRAQRVGAAGLDAWAADNLIAYLREQREATGHLPTTARSSSSGSATSSATGGWPCTRRSARQVHAPVGAVRGGAGCASGSGSTCRPCTATTASCCRLPDLEFDGPDRRRGPWQRPELLELVVARARRGAPTWSPSSSAARRCSPRGSASARPARCCCRGAGPTGDSRCGSSGSAPRSCSRWPASTRSFPIILETVRECLQDVFDVPGLPS